MNESPRHPIQPLVVDGAGVLRFKANEIVRYLLDAGPFDLNHLVLRGFSSEDHEQFAQLIGYSHSGAGSLSYFSTGTWEAAGAMHEHGVTEDQARVETLEETLRTIRDGLRIAVPAAFDVHPDDLQS